MKYCVPICIVVLALLCACETATDSTAEAPAPTPAMSLADGQAMADAYAAALESGSVETLVSMFTDDAMILPADAPAVVGKEAIRGQFEASAKTPQKLSVKVEAVLGDGDTGCSRGVFTSSMTPEGAAEPISVTGKWVSVSRLQPDGSRKIQWHIWNADAPMPSPTM